MEDTTKHTGEILHPNNFKCKTYWKYRDGNEAPFEEPEQRTSQYEMGIKDEGYGKKIWIKIFSRVGIDPLHKRDYYTYYEYPIECTFTRSLLAILKDNLE
jgi:hypothetical protein